MISTILLPNAGGDLDECVRNPGGDDSFEILASDDADTSYIESNGTASARTTVALEDAAPYMIQIKSYTLSTKARKTGAGTPSGRLIIRDAGTNVNAPATFSPGGAYATFTADFANPVGGGAWSRAAVNAHQAGLSLPSNAPDEVHRATYLWATIGWDPTQGGLVFLLMDILGPVWGAGLLLGDVARMCRALAPRTIVSGAEVERAWRELQEYRAPAYGL